MALFALYGSFIVEMIDCLSIVLKTPWRSKQVDSTALYEVYFRLKTIKSNEGAPDEQIYIRRDEKDSTDFRSVI